MKKSIFLILPAVMLMLASCMDSAGGNGGAGSVRVVLPGSSRAVSSSDRADSYTVSLLKGGSIIESQTAVPGGAVEFDEVDAGSYTVKVWASKGGEICGVGKNSVEVSAGESAPCEIKMRTAYSASAAAEYIKTLGGDNYNVIVAGPADDNAIAGIKAALAGNNMNGTVALDLSWTTGLTEIAGGAFEGCARLSSVVLPEGITAIWENSFAGCASLTSIEIPNSVTTIGDDAFKSCEALAAVYYNGTKKQWLSLKSSSIENSSGNTMLIMSKIICSDGEISPDYFVKVPGISITGGETWTPDSKVFVSGRSLNIEAFYMCDHEVTQAEWKDVMGSAPSGMAPADGTEDNNPVNNVSWYDALVYCNRRSIKEGLTPCYTINGSTDPNDWADVLNLADPDSKWDAATWDNRKANGYRLPTEAEWEWAARGGKNYTYAGSNTLDEVAWHKGNSNSMTHEVKTKTANGYGLYDMSGNVLEWCWDWSSGDDILDDTPDTGPSSGILHRLRGGCFWQYSTEYDVACNSHVPYPRGNFCGLRLVRSSE